MWEQGGGAARWSRWESRWASVLVVGLALVVLLPAGWAAHPAAPLSGLTAPSPSPVRPNPPPPGAPGPHNWTEECSAPCATYRGMMVYDPSAGYDLYLDGIGVGADSSPVNPVPTWEFVNGNWTPVPGKAPPYREYGSMAYDTHDGYAVVFGGCLVSRGCVAGSVLGDTWKFGGGGWSALAPTTSPPARYGAAMTYDSADHEVVLFGGETAGGARLNDTWVFANGQWTNATVANASAPSARAYGSLADDPADGYAVLVGGFNGSSLNDTWSFTGGNWTLQHPALLPPASFGGAVTYDSSHGRVLFVPGGTNSSWGYSAGSWSRLTGIVRGTTFQFGEVADLPMNSTVALIGGYSPACNVKVDCGSTYESLKSHWDEVVPYPSFRQAAALAYDPSSNATVLFGGAVKSGALADTWSYVNDRWTQLTPATSPSARAYSAMVYDASDGYLLLFGGATTVELNDTWTFHAGKWSQLHPATSPTVRTGTLMTYDAALGEVILFDQGGVKGKFVNSTWSFHAGAWTLLGSAGGPTVNLNALAYDPTEGGDVALGTAANGTISTWLFSNGNWSLLKSPTEPKHVDLLAFDAAHGFLLTYDSRHESFKFVNGKWSSVAPPVSPAPRSQFGFTYDGADGYVLLFGGTYFRTDGLALYGDTWSY